MSSDCRAWPLLQGGAACGNKGEKTNKHTFLRARRLNDHTVSTWRTALTYQTLVDDAEHVCVVQEDVRWVFRTEADVGDGGVPVQPQRVQSSFLQLPTPLCVFFLQQRVLKDL